MKAQNAMEYLMTYGWAILVIAVVLGALFELGIFSADTFAPRAQAGSCYVFRPRGTGTTFDIGLAGLCNGNIPQYVASFDGQGGYINRTAIGSTSGSFTVVGWASPQSTAAMDIVGTRHPSNTCFDMKFTSGTTIHGDIGTGSSWITTGADATFAYSTNKWYQVAYSVNETNYEIYVNGVQVHTGSYSSSIPMLLSSSCDLFIGQDGGNSEYFNGTISNIQIYNKSLSASQIAELYQGGIGGAPISDGLNNLVGWWPLNGDTYDYSGNGFNLNISGDVTYTSRWTTGYSGP